MFSLNPTKDLTKIGEKVTRRRVPTGHISSMKMATMSTDIYHTHLTMLGV